jgi:translation elongation factor EF-1beta
VILIEKLYDKLEKGEIKCNNKDNESSAFTLKKIPNIVKLFADKNEKPNFDNIILSVEDIKEIDSDEIKSIRSDSSNSLDCVIECETRKK